MMHLAWYLRQSGMRLGRTGVGACVLLLASAALHWGWTVPGLARLEREEGQRQAQLTRVRLPAVRADATEAGLAALVARLPPSGNGALNAVAGVVHAQALRHGVALDSASYELSRPDRGDIERYTVSLPVKGSYPALRAFLDGLARELPHMALDSVVLARRSRDQPALEARLQFTAFFRSRP